MPRKKILIAVGGTGGHVLPAQVFGDRVAEFADVFYAGVGLEKNPYMRFEGKVVEGIEGGNFSKGAFSGMQKILRGFCQSKEILKKQNIEYVIGFGSYHSLPIILSAIYLGIPYSLVETNVLPGKVNRFLSRWARRTMIHFDPAREKLFGKINLVHYDFARKSQSKAQEEARLYFGLDPGKTTLLVFGGSQGAEVINQYMRELADRIPKSCQVIHFTGKETDLADVYQRARVSSYVKPFSSEMEIAWQASNLVICRAGAGALREMLVHEKGGILIPYPEAKEGHQEKNAIFMETIVQGALHLPQNKLTPHLLLEKINSLLADQGQKLEEMRRSLRSYKEKEKRPDIIKVIEEDL